MVFSTARTVVSGLWRKEVEGAEAGILFLPGASRPGLSLHFKVEREELVVAGPESQGKELDPRVVEVGPRE